MLEQIYGTIQYARLGEQVARQIQEMILDGRLPVGSQLPPERELAEKFGVSRTVIREAIKVLSERGLIEVVPGRGSFVTLLDAASAAFNLGLLVKAHGASLTQFHEIRSVLEVAATGLAAERATPEDLTRLREMADRMDGYLSTDAQEEFVDADVAFHSFLADASHNPLFQVVLSPIIDILAEIRRVTYHIADSPRRGQGFHHRILACIERADVEGARETMTEHMVQVEGDLRIAEASLLAEGRR
jgi:GntR family transcriptional regulator, transcriptional repressor for pyruvate dehydrogenase complex